jgi:hypothetical protein
MLGGTPVSAEEKKVAVTAAAPTNEQVAAKMKWLPITIVAMAQILVIANISTVNVSIGPSTVHKVRRCASGYSAARADSYVYFDLEIETAFH